MVANIPVVVAGTGFGLRIQVPSLRAAGFDVVGLVGADAERTKRRAEKGGIAQTFTDLDEAIACTGAKAVAIATPPHTHAPLVLAAISRGCHVLCEKPFARDAAEARQLLDAAERAGLVHMIGHEFRWAPERAHAARALAEGLVGAPRMMTLALYGAIVANPELKMPGWWFDVAAGGGWLGASGSHVIDQVRTWLGDFAAVSAALPIVSARTDVAEDSYVIRFRLTNGVEGVLQQSGGAWGPVATMARVAGTDGTIWLDSGAVWLADRNGPRQLPMPADLALPPAKPGDDPKQAQMQMELGPYVRLCEAFRARIEGRTPDSPVKPATFADGVACMQVIDAIRASAAKGGAVVAI